MKIKALTAVRDGKRYFAPGEQWDCRKSLADKLIAWGGAEKVVDPDPEPKTNLESE